MQNISYFIKCNKRSLINVIATNYRVIVNKFNIIRINNNVLSNNYISIQNIEKQQNLYSIIKLDNNTTTNNNSDDIELIPFTDDKIDILYNPKELIFHTTQTLLTQEEIDKYIVSIINTEASSIISILYESNIIFNTTIIKLSNAKIIKNNHYIIILGIPKNNYYLLIIDTNNLNIVFNDLVNSINNTDTDICAIKNLKTIYKYSSIFKLNFESNSISKYYSYSKSNSQINICKYLIPKALLQAILVGDNSTIKLLLSDKFTDTDINKLKSYFGNFSQIYLNTHHIKNNDINYTIKCETNYKNYSFIFNNNNKIIDIVENF